MDEFPKEIRSQVDEAGQKAYEDALAAGMNEKTAKSMGDDAAKAVGDAYRASLNSGSPEAPEALVVPVYDEDAERKSQEEADAMLTAGQAVEVPLEAKEPLTDSEKADFALAIAKFTASKVPGCLEECKTIFPRAF